MGLLGIHIGTTRCTASIYSDAGALVTHETQVYPQASLESGSMTLDAETVITTACSLIRRVTRGNGHTPIHAMSITAQGETMQAVDAEGHALGPVLMAFDSDTEYVWEQSFSRISEERIYALTGLPPHAMYSLPHILWWQRQRPDLVRSTTRYLTLDALLWQHLGLEPVTDYSLGGRTMLMDLLAKRWSPEIMAEASLSEAQLPVLAAAGTVIGTLTGRHASALGLPNKVMAVVGGYDQACEALACGVTEPGQAMDATGLVESLVPVVAPPVINDRMREAGYACYPHVVPDRYLSLAYYFSAGALLRWYRETFGQLEEEEARISGLPFSEILLGKASHGPSPVLVLPHFAATGTPWNDPAASGAVVGITLTTTRADIAKALFDGMAYEVLLNIERFEEAGVPIAEIHVVGMGETFSPWLQLKADIYHRPVLGMSHADAATRGAAMIAGVGAGVYPDFPAAITQMVAPADRMMPQPEAVSAYDRQFTRYRRLYPALRTVFSA